MKFWLVDAFTHRAFAGNPAGVCVVDEFPSDIIMQKIAREFNWSQTAFVKPLSPHHFHIRWFSPQDEAPICGHATLASAHILWETGIAQEDTVWFQSLAGPLVVQREPDQSIVLDFPKRPIQPCVFSDELYDVLGGIMVESVMRDDEALLRDEWIYVVTLPDFQDLVNLKPRLDLLASMACRALCVTAIGPDGYDFASRYFAPKVGIFEDPVCGSAHCRLAPYWGEKLNKKELLAYQASSRSGVIRCRFDDQRVYLGGQALTICQGRFPAIQLDLGDI